MSDAFFNRPRVVWATQSPTIHDQRFIRALVEARWSVIFLPVIGNIQDLQLSACDRPFVVTDDLGGTNQLGERTREISARLEDVVAMYRPHLVWAGPLTTVARDIAAATELPLVAMSWGYDLLLDVAADPFTAAAATSTIECAARVHVDSAAGRRAAIQLGALPENVIEFPWGIDLEAFPLRTPPPLGSQLTVVSARSMEPVYDVATTIRGFAQFKRQRPQLSARLVLVGSGSLEADLRGLAADLGIDSQIDWLGRLSESDLRQVLAISTVYVSSSTIDGSSITLMQAMATGLTPVVSDVGGNCEWIQHGKTGLLFAPGDAKGLAMRLEESLDSASFRDAIGSAAREEVERRGDWELHRATFIEVCRVLSGLA